MKIKNTLDFGLFYYSKGFGHLDILIYLFGIFQPAFEVLDPEDVKEGDEDKKLENMDEEIDEKLKDIPKSVLEGACKSFLLIDSIMSNCLQSYQFQISMGLLENYVTR